MTFTFEHHLKALVYLTNCTWSCSLNIDCGLIIYFFRMKCYIPTIQKNIFGKQLCNHRWYLFQARPPRF